MAFAQNSPSSVRCFEPSGSSVVAIVQFVGQKIERKNSVNPGLERFFSSSLEWSRPGHFTTNTLFTWLWNIGVTDNFGLYKECAVAIHGD